MLDLIETFLDGMERNPEYSERTHEQYRSKLRQFVRWCAADPVGRPFERSTVVSYLKERQEQVGPKTLKIALTALRSFLAWSKKQGHGEGPDLREIRLPKAGPGRRRKPSDEEVKRLYSAANTLPQFNESLRLQRFKTRAIIVLLCECGLRTMELLALNVSDIIRRTGVQADGSPEPWLIRIRNGKGGSWDELEISDAAQPWIEEWLEVRTEWAGQRKMHSPAKEALFPVSKCRRMAERALKRLWDELLQFAELGNSQLQRHAMRHWFGTTVAEREGLKTAQRLLRHSSILTTEKYLYTDDSKARRAVNAVAAVIRDGADARPAERRPEKGSYPAESLQRQARPLRGRGRFVRHDRPAA